MHKTTLAATAAAAVMAFATVATASSLDRVIMTAYEVGSSGYNHGVAMGAQLKEKHGGTLRVLPGRNDLSRLEPVRQDRADYALNGIGTYMAQEGAFEFSTRNWGPQPLRLMASNVGGNCLMLWSAGDIGVKTVADLKGKRVSIVKAAPALNYNSEAILRFGDLTLDDVETVEFGSGTAAADAGVQGRVDTGFTSTISGWPKKLEASPRGLAWPSMPASDTEGWKRVTDFAPHFFPHKCTLGAQLSKDKPVEGAAYPYPILMAYAAKDEQAVYEMTKFLFDNFEEMKDASPGMDGYALDNQRLSYVVPYHPGAIRYYKEAGRWTAENQANQEELLKRQELLASLWKDTLAEHKDASDEEWTAAWMKARADGLRAAGAQVSFETW